MIGESATASPKQRTEMLELMFETFECPSLFLAPNPMLAAFAAGRQSALVVDCGGGGTSVCPVLDGYVLRKPTVRSVRGGQWLSNEVKTGVGEGGGGQEELLPSFLLRCF